MVRHFSLLALAASSAVANIIPTRDLATTVASPGFISFPVTKERITRQGATKRLARRQVSTSLQDISDTSYLIQLSFGTPAQPVKVVIDTGSNELFVNPNCKDSSLSADLKAECISDGSYNYNTSSTANVTNTGRTITFGTGAVKIRYVVDTVGIPGTSVSLKNSQFGVAVASQDLADGILGLGFGQGVNLKYAGFVDQLAAQKVTNTKAFGIALGAEGSGTGAGVVFGGVDTKKFGGKLISNPILAATAGDIARYSIQMNSISMNNGAGYSGSNTAVVLDTGSSLCNLPSSIVTAMAKDFKGQLDQDSGLYVVDCSYQTQSGAIDFAFPGITIAVPFADFILDAGSNVCVLGVQAIQANSGITALLGDTFLRSAYVVFDQTNNQISMAQYNNCGTNVQAIPAGSGGISGFTGECSGGSNSTSTTGSGSGSSSSSGTGTTGKNGAGVLRPVAFASVTMACLAVAMSFF